MSENQRNLNSKLSISIVRACEAEWHLLQKLFPMYKNAGYEVQFIGWDRYSQKHKRTMVDSVEHYYILQGWGYANWKLLFAYPVWMISLLWHFLYTKTDIVHVGEFPSAFPVAIALYFRNIPMIYDIQDNFDQVHHWPLNIGKLIKKLDAWVIRRAAGIIVTDENRIVGALETARSKISVVPNCPNDVPLPTYQPTSKATTELTVMVMGHLAERRGVDLLLDAISELSNVRVLMAGIFVEPWLKQKASSMAAVDFRGQLSQHEVLELCHSADLIFSFYDPAYEINLKASSTKWFDAMMVGKPILLNCEVMKASWVEQEDIGYLCPYGNKYALVDILRKIKNNKEEAMQKGKKGRLLFEKEFNWYVMQKRILNLIRSVSKTANSI
jgi:glycosyltransferase involved in cell wall biosynthesis